MSKRMLVLMCSIFLIVPLLFMGCGSDGSDGKNGINGTNGRDLTATLAPESCVVCHSTAGANHQASYDQLYQDNVIVVSGVTYALNGANRDVVTFNMTKAGVNFDCTKVQNLNIYFTQYNDNGTFGFNPVAARLSIKGTLAYNGAGVCTSTGPAHPTALDNVNLSTVNGLIVVYGYDESTGVLPGTRVQQDAYPYAALLETGTVNYVSAANVSGCEKCHIVPFLKHGNIYGQVNHDPATDFYTCKACHLDNGPGSDFVWQLLVNDPVAAAAIEAGGAYTPAQQTQYAYKTRLMNDTHMSHAMEFEYPQSMANCATCHAGKLDKIFTDNNFVLETCKSCHPVTGSAQAEKMVGLALSQIVPHTLTGRDNCYGCHAGQFSAVTGHTGYDKVIYTDNGVRYSNVFTVTIDNASFDNNLLTFAFHATESPNLPGLAVDNIVPGVMVGLYGWDTKDFLVGPHETLNGKRTLEYTPGATNNSPYITLTTVSAGSWRVTANLSTWDNIIKAGKVKKVEMAVMPSLKNADNVVLALNAPSRTYDLKAKAFAANYYSGTNAIVKVTAGCNNCHDALGTTFHTPDRGGNIVVCRLCHTERSGGSHLELQSRAIDSYAHAIHTFQAFDINTVDFNDPVQAMFYNLHVESHFPTFRVNDCVSCHNAGKFNAPDQGKSLPAVLSGSEFPLIGRTRNIGIVPSYVVGPATRACGGCHRAEFIIEDSATGLSSFMSHTRTNGYQVEYTSPADFDRVLDAIMPNVDGGFLPAP